MEFISPAQCRAARGILDWSQPDLAKRCDTHIQTISGFENETRTPTKTTLEKIKLALENAGIEFSKHDGLCKRQDLIIKYEGYDCFDRFLTEAYKTLKYNKEEILFCGGHEIRSRDSTIQLIRKFIKSEIPIRRLIENGNTEIMGNVDDYKWIPDKLFIDTDVKIIYQDCIAYLMSWRNEEKVIVIKDKSIAEDARRNFNYVWGHAKPATHSTSSRKY